MPKWATKQAVNKGHISVFDMLYQDLKDLTKMQKKCAKVLLFLYFLSTMSSGLKDIKYSANLLAKQAFLTFFLH